MDAKADLTPGQIIQLRALAGEGNGKTEAARVLGVDRNWIDRSALRLGIKDEIDELFPTKGRGAFAFTDEVMDKMARLAGAGLTMRAACERVGASPDTVKSAADRAGKRDELRALFPMYKKKPKPVRPARGELPRHDCPAVKWLTQSWKVAA